MDKLTIVGHFTKTVELLRNTECSQKEKLNYFHQISDYILSPQMISHVNFSKHCSNAIAILLFFCEDLESIVRMNAEENLNRIIRSLETTRVSRILLDLYNEIKKNGNQKSLRICLNIFAYYCPRIKEKNIKWYAMKIMTCIEMIATRKETLLIETLSEFMKSFGKHLQCCLSDNETFKLMEIFLKGITSDCAVKRRCSAQNCVTLMENSKNKYFMAKNCLNRALDFLINDQQQTTNILLGVLGYFRLLLPIIIFENLTEPKQIIEIYDFCLYLLNNQNHSIINASLEVINSILNRLPDSNSTATTIKTYDNDACCNIEEFLTNRNSDHRLRHNEILKKRKSLKNQIFQLRTNSTCGTVTMVKMMRPNEYEKHQQQQHKYQKSEQNYTITMMEKDFPQMKNKIEQQNQQQQQISTKSTTSETIRNELNKGRKKSITFDDVLDNNILDKNTNKITENLSGKNSSNFFVSLDVDDKIDTNTIEQKLMSTTMEEDKENSDGFTTLSELNDSNDDGYNDDNQLPIRERAGNDVLIDDKSQIMSDIDNESFNSIDFESEITIGEQQEQKTESVKSKEKGGSKNDWKLQKSTDSIGSFFNNFLSQSSAAESMTKLFRPSVTKFSTRTTSTEHVNNSATNTPNLKKRSISNLVEQQRKIPLTISHFNIEDDTISLESINSHISFGSHVSNQSNSIQEYQHSKNDQNLVTTTIVQQQNLENENHQINENFLNIQERQTTKIVADLEQNIRSPLIRSEQTFEKSSTLTTNLIDKTMINEDEMSASTTNKFENKLGIVEVDKAQSAFDKFDIGTIYDQPIIYYTTRLITSKFLLTGLPVNWQNDENYSTSMISDTLIRVSIKNLALLVIANCIKLMPEILYLSIEIDQIQLNKIRELNLKENIEEDAESISSSSSSSSNIENICQIIDDNSKIAMPKKSITELKSVVNHPLNNDNDDDDNNLLLNIKDDHFGESTTKNLFDNTLSRSADPVIFSESKNISGSSKNKSVIGKSLSKSNFNRYNYNQNEIILSKSEIIESKSNLVRIGGKISSSSSKLIKPKLNESTKITKNNQTLIELSTNVIGENLNEKKYNNGQKFESKQQNWNNIQQQKLWLNEIDRDYQMTSSINDYKKQFIHDILLFYNHSDPILRGDVQVIIGNFIHGILLLSSNQYYNRFSGLLSRKQDTEQDKQLQLLHPLNINRLFAILIKGLRDDIHTVVIQAMSSFDKIYPVVMVRHFNMIPKRCHHSQHSRRLQNSTDILYKDNDVDNTIFLETLLMLKSMKDINIITATTTTTTTASSSVHHDNNNKFCTNDDNRTGNKNSTIFLQISPKFLLNEFRLCYHNKYWLVQNKYTEVASNLKYDEIREFYSDDIVCSYEKMFFNEIIQFLGDEDVRVREQTVENLCNYIKNRNYHKTNERNKYDINNKEIDSFQYYCNNFNLIKEYLNYHIFNGMSVTFSNLLNSNYLPCFEIEKLLSRILYILTNKLMEINDKNMQFGIITAVKIMLNEFNPVDYFDTWNEFNFSTICIQYSIQNYITATDLNCQNDLIEITTKLLSAQFLSGKINNHRLNDNLFIHIMKILNMYYHIFGNQKPIIFAKSQKNDLFSNSKELAILNLCGYFGNDYLYIKLYNILKSAFDNYKITINHESGKKIMSLLKTCLNSLAACLEMKDHSTINITTTATTSSNIGNIQITNSITNQTVKLIDEILQYLSILINYKPVETIGCLKQLLKFLFGRNYANRQNEYEKFIKFYLMARNLKKYTTINLNRNPTNNNRKKSNHFVMDDDDDNENIFENHMCLKQKNNLNLKTENEEIIFDDDGQNNIKNNTKKFINKIYPNDKYYKNENEQNEIEENKDEKEAATTSAFRTIFGELFSNSMNFPLGKSKSEEECARHIKLFEPLVIFCLSLFMKSNAKVQGPILDLLSQLLEFNVTYSILDSKSVIFEQVLKNLELIESGVARNSTDIISPIIRFLVNITNQNDKKLMTIPKIISITNSLLANNFIKDCSLLALKTLSFEIFFIMDNSIITTNSVPVSDLMLTVNAKELNTQKEVIFGMLEKFIDSIECQKVLGILMVRQQNNIIIKNNVVMQCHQQLKQSSYSTESTNNNDFGAAVADAGVDDGSYNICLKNEYENNEYLSFVDDVQASTSISASSIQNEVIFSIVIKGLVDSKINVNNWNDFFVLDSLFRNNDKNVLLDSKGFLSLLSLFITKTVKNFSDLSIAMIILDNVILKTEEIYLVNHIKLYLKNHESQQHELKKTITTTTATRTTNEINYFAKVLYKMLDECFLILKNIPPYRQQQQHSNINNINNNNNNICNINTNNKKFSKLVVKFVRALNNHISKKDSLQSAFRYELIENEFWENYYQHNNHYNFLYINNLKVEIICIFCKFELNASIPDKISILMKLVKLDRQYKNVQYKLLRNIIMKFDEPKLWSLPEIEILLTEFFWITINNFQKFINNLCNIPEYQDIFIKILYKYFDEDTISKEELQVVLKFINNSKNISFELKIQLLTNVYNIRRFRANNDVLENLIVQIIENDIESQEKKKNITKNLLGESQFKFILKNWKINEEYGKNDLCKLDQQIVDENWLMEQIINYSSLSNPDEYVKILLDIKSEIKLKQILNHPNFNLCNILKSCIEISFQTMINSFQNDCVNFNPHINYMNMNSLLRVTINTLKDKLDNFDINNLNYLKTNDNNNNNLLYLPISIMTFIENIKYLENISLMYIEYRFIEKFIKDHIFKSETLIDTLIQFILIISNYLINDYQINLQENLNPNDDDNNSKINSTEIYTYLKCINILLNDKFIWFELNQSEKYNIHLNTILEFLYYGMIKSIRNTIFYKKYQIQIITTSDYQLYNNIVRSNNKSTSSSSNIRNSYNNVKEKNNIKQNFTSSEITKRTDDVDDDDTKLMVPEQKLLLHQHSHEEHQFDLKQQQENPEYKRNVIQKAIFIGKLIEMNCNVNDENSSEKSSMEILKSIGISLLRMNKFYAYAVTPFEIFQSGGYEHHYQGNSSSKLPTIAVEHLSDADILEKFVKRLSIFGFTARQQFEEYFMTFLLLINTVYDENMVDVQEQFQIKSTCFEAILELLITYKTFPIVGNKLSRFHHSTRLSKIRCDSISLKKLHKVQLLLPESNIFYQSNLERNSSMKLNFNDNIIGTNYFLPNQYDLNFVWQLMENTSSSSSLSLATTTSELDVSEDVYMKNFRYFRQMSEIDFNSSTQLIFDVLTQFIDQNHILVLPNLVKFCEICENRDQVKWIKRKVLKLQETIPSDDTISHQHIIYLLCKTQSMLIPSSSDLSHLCTLISTYLKSSHVFIRNATLHGLLCLLECCSKTNTTIGKLSEELLILRDLIVGYITRHGIIEESSIVFSDLHTKLVWTLNFYLIEMTTKFVPDCHLLSNTIISANNLLKRTSNESVYLCILHGLERIIVMDIAPLAMRNKIEKLALELLKLDNEKFSISALKLLLSCIYMGSAKQLENTELSNGIVQDDPEIIAQQTDKLDILLHCIKSSTKSAAKIYGQVLCQVIRDLVPPKEILTKVIKEFLAINQPHCDVIARIVHQVFRSAIDSSFLQMLQEWLICTLPTFVNLPDDKSVWCLTIIFISASINLHLIKLFPVVLNEDEFKLTKNINSSNSLTSSEITLFVTSAKDFYSKLNQDQKLRFREAFQYQTILNKQQHEQEQKPMENEKLQWKVFQLMLESL